MSSHFTRHSEREVVIPSVTTITTNLSDTNANSTYHDTGSQNESERSPTLLAQAQQTWRALLPGNTREHREQAVLPAARPTTLNTVNSRQNCTWGDELQEKSDLSTRIYAINLNGLQLDNRGGQFDTTCRVLKEIQADIFCGQEHNLDTTQPSLRNILYDTANQHWQRHRLAFATTPIPFRRSYKPGGTTIMTVGSTTGRVCKQIRDKWGRWSGHEFRCSDIRRLLILSVYQPIDKGQQAGKITVSAQQRSLLLQNNDPTSNPLVAFRRDLSSMLKSYHENGHDILLIGDFNEPLGSNDDGISKIASDFQLLDLMGSRHSSEPPATYARGSRRLDYALATKNVWHAMEHSGYEAFNARMSSDHRGYFLDFNTELLFGSATQTLANRATRGLSATNAVQVTAYIRHKHEILVNCNAFERAQKLHQSCDRHAYAERLDSDILNASLAAEKRLPHFDEPAWSRDLALSRQKVALLKKQLSALKTGLDHRTILISGRQLLDSSFTLPNTISECSTMLREAKKEVQEKVETSIERRDFERNRKLKALDESGTPADKHMATQLRRIKKAEDIKNLFKKLKHVRTKGVRSGVTRIEIPRHEGTDPKTCSDWIQVDIPSEVLRLLQQRNQSHFGQAFGTPFTIPPLATDLGFDGSTAAGDRILNGTYDHPDLDSNVRLLLSHLKYVDEIQNHDIRPTISSEKFSSKLKIWSESTTTSPSGLHLGHFKALIAKHSFSSDSFDEDLTVSDRIQRAELDAKQRDLFDLHLAMINYALERGYSYVRWRTIANTILFKDPDNVRLHRTRVLHIYEADFNLALGIKWRAATHHAEDTRALNDGQYGSRPNRSATDPVFIEELQLEISRATRKPVVLTNYDATACYDRIIPNLGMLVSRKYGIPDTVAQMNAATLSTAEYRVRTELGLAPTGYTHTDSAPIYGTGQGSANSPAIWCFLSSALFDSYDQVSTPAQYYTPSMEPTATLGMIGYVDDCNGQTNAFHLDGSQSTVDKLVHQTQHNAQVWSDILYSSGGVLEVSKCSCHILQWKFTPQGAPYLVAEHPHFKDAIRVQDRQLNQTKHLKVLSVYESHKTLGHHKEPMGNQKEQYRQLLRKSDDSTSFLWNCPLSRLEAWTYYYACYLPSVGYPLSCSSLTRQQLETVQRKAMSIIIARCGFNRNTKKEILYGPLELGGANFRPLYVQQGVGQVLLFLKHWRLQSAAGNLLKVALAWFQQQTGVSYSILATVTTPLPHLESKWIKSLRDFLASTTIHLTVDDPAIPPPQRERDLHLMDVILESRAFTDAEIRKLNYCRLHLKASTLSDITNVDGITLDKAKLSGSVSFLSSVSHGDFIHQDKPSDTAWQLWRRANKLWSRADGTLFEHLGSWIVPSHTQRQQHFAYLEHRHLFPCDHVLWIRGDQGYQKCLPAERRNFFLETNTHSTTWTDLPPDTTPVIAWLDQPGTWQVEITTTSLWRPPPPLIASTFTEYISMLPPWEAELLGFVETSLDPFSVAHALSYGVRAVSDGSVWDGNQGSFGWMVSTKEGDRLARGMGPARGSQVDSYRAEAYGMLTVSTFLSRLAAFTGYQESWVGIIATDSQSLLDTIADRTVSPSDDTPPVYSVVKKLQDLDVNCPEWDLLSSFVVSLATYPGIKLEYVKGHQDRSRAYHGLPLMAQLNVDADAMATRFQCEHGASRPIVLLTPTARVHLVTANGTHTSHYESVIRHQATKPGLMKHIQTKNDWSDYITSQINWKAHGSILRRRLKHRTHFIKLVHGLLPTCQQLHRHDPIRRLCPLCKTKVEDWQHVLTCSHPTRSSWRHSALQIIMEKSKSLGTRPLLQRILRDAILKWFDDSNCNLDPRLYPKEVHKLIWQQNQIGWKHIWLGRFTTEWSDLEDNFYARRPKAKAVKRQTGQRWQVAIIGILWDQWRLVWEARNKDLHGADAHHRALAETREVHRDLRDLYDHRARLDPQVQAVMYDDIIEHYSRPTWFNQNWISIHGPLIRDNLKRVAARAKAGMKSIRQYMTAPQQN